jgi:CSLREA domain-containing protein
VSSKARLSRGTMLALILGAFGALGAPSAASAATITVNTTADDFGPNATCSVREAVQSVNNAVDFGGCIATILPNAYGFADEIDVPAGLFKLSRAGTGEDLNSTGDLDLRKAVKIVGAGDSPAGTEIDADNIDRVLDLPSVAGAVVVTVQSLTLGNGNAVAANGGAIRVSDLDGSIKVQDSTIESSDAGLKGGAIYFEGATSSTPINVVDSELVGNSAADDGGAIQYGNSNAQVAVERSSLIGNTAGAEGGGFYLSAPDLGPFPSVRIINSTFAGNSAVGGGGAVGLGGGRQQVFSQFSTYAGNSTPAAGQGGAFRTDTGGATADEVYLLSTILAGNTAAGVPASCGGPAGLYPIANFNVASDSSCPLAGTANLLGTDPLLAPLAANGGPTRTMGLYDTSPAIDHVPTTNCFLIPMTDQRSQPRPVGGACDAGAFEGSVGPVPTPPAPPTTVPTTHAKKKCKKKKKKHAASVAKKCKKKKRK